MSGDSQQQQLYADQLEGLSDLRAALEIACDLIVQAAARSPDFKGTVKLVSDGGRITLEIVLND
jgi:hypothetical protein